METRILIALALIALGAAAYAGWNRWQLARLGRRPASQLPGLEGLRPGVPAILYFTSPGCAPCRTVQRPALARLQSERGDGLQIVEVDATQRPDLADHWGVLSVPTTFVVDAAGRPRRVNHGVTSRDRLDQQLAEIANRAPDTAASTVGAVRLDP